MFKKEGVYYLVKGLLNLDCDHGKLIRKLKQTKGERDGRGEGVKIKRKWEMRIIRV